MNPIVRNVLAVIVGMAVNMGLIMVSGSVIPLPEGIDPTKMESLVKNIHLFQPKHFLFPFLAHALGTLAGAAVVASIAATREFRFAMGIGIFFLVGGVANTFMIPAPAWFIGADLLLAYLPMGYLGWVLVGKPAEQPAA